LQDLDVRGRITLKCILNKYNVRVCSDLYGIRLGAVVGFFEHGNELMGSIKGREFLDLPNNN